MSSVMAASTRLTAKKRFSGTRSTDIKAMLNSSGPMIGYGARFTDLFRSVA